MTDLTDYKRLKRDVAVSGHAFTKLFFPEDHARIPVSFL